MPSTVVHAGFALLLAAGLLGAYYDRRALAVLLVVLVLPEADSFLGVVMAGAHRTVGHNFVLPAVAALALYYDTRVRDRSLVRDRLSDRWVAVAWVALFVHVFAHVAIDWTHLDGVNAFWPLRDRFFQLDGEIYYSTAEGFVQTFVDVRVDPETGTRTVDAGAGGTSESVHVSNPVQPRDPDVDVEEPVERRFPIASRGWRLYLVGLGLFALAARRLQSDVAADRE
ncbi:metal-dependent hydrolase [Halorubrum sp. GN11_10-6_MGM]|uniref:metal-dependent hydrolase n=1 Tax=Halorubrum sp. GN11_10-6_MGM TaxID=2518112 RepID=UPI0010F43FDE|nr:metal-dependent hydrolase [Halorubrum sp. GN11_10-6_MGM]TKX73109.1 metal-dependent hydrolase [Halorubrum sp. GN11_10-6_MGM]